MSPRDVVIIGAGQLRNNRERDFDSATEPLELILRAAAASAEDAGVGAAELSGVDLVAAVQIVSWSYADDACVVAERLGATDARCVTSGAGGHQPVAMLQHIAGRIAEGEAELALLCGGEAQSSLEMFQRADAEIPWSRDPGGPGKFDRAVGGTERMWDLGLVGPIRIYPLFENRLRYELGQSFAEAQDWSARMYSEFSAVAAGNEAAWNPVPRTPEEIATVGPKNRMICFPYPLLMNATAKVDQAAALLVASAETADRLGVPESKRIHVLSAASGSDCEDVLERPTFGASAGMAGALDRALDGAGLGMSDVDVLDLYSCFPVVPKLGSLHLKATGRALSATGGLTSFGGAHNNYSSHALVAVTRELRRTGGTGLVYANGEYVTKHSATVLSGRARPEGFVASEAIGTPQTVRVVDHYIGEAVVETYTVEYDREAEPARGYVVASLPGGGRTGVRVSKKDTYTLGELVSQDREPIGRTGRITESDGRRTFALEGAA
ncbi:acetyl-CoA acetyltransferase [Amycolatopsis sp. K13G38]|uniref:Acetyl-CoA acetyltransferase n=1 Tax=Amycolatopsis acididurans TaxID=2724524 RepID=A0ABX1JAL7_9PSEU|nr:acetyl-CoA acetyltransferase [Amycolatopsis acididurans]NKQ56729.1 acetyl-CoA acetyltransferase [Amycolatopsis acididurans]